MNHSIQTLSKNEMQLVTGGHEDGTTHFHVTEIVTLIVAEVAAIGAAVTLCGAPPVLTGAVVLLVAGGALAYYLWPESTQKDNSQYI